MLVPKWVYRFRGYLVSVYKFSFFVIPAKAGIQNVLKRLDSRFHGNDKKREIAAFMDRL